MKSIEVEEAPMAADALQEKYEELYGVAPDNALTVKDLEKAIESFEPVPEPETAEAPKKASGRVHVGSVE